MLDGSWAKGEKWFLEAVSMVNTGIASPGEQLSAAMVHVSIENETQPIVECEYLQQESFHTTQHRDGACVHRERDPAHCGV